MRQCQRGEPLPHGGFTGSVCRKPMLCREEGRCYFVAGVERYLELHNGYMPGELEALVAAAVPTIPWQLGYDGYSWAI